MQNSQICVVATELASNGCVFFLLIVEGKLPDDVDYGEETDPSMVSHPQAVLHQSLSLTMFSFSHFTVHMDELWMDQEAVTSILPYFDFVIILGAQYKLEHVRSVNKKGH